jgi:hypothetical protein
MHPQDEKLLNTLQFGLLLLIIILATKTCTKQENVNIESCKPIGCMELNNASQHQATEQR